MRRFVLALVILATAPPALAGRLTCRDGDPNIVISPRGLGGPAFCNHDEPGDGACTFAICGRLCPRCVDIRSPVCPEGPLPPYALEVNVPVRKTRVRMIDGSRVRFRCRAPVPCDAEHDCTAMTPTCQDGVAADRTCDFDGQADGVCT